MFVSSLKNLHPRDGQTPQSAKKAQLAFGRKNTDSTFMDQAVEQSMAFLNKQYRGQQYGGPFGSVIVKDGVVLGVGANEVTNPKHPDPTAHGEIMAIRNACAKQATLGVKDSHFLTGATLYTSSEPCLMCYSASKWANISRIVYSNTVAHADKIAGFKNDTSLFDDAKKPPGQRSIPMEQLHRTKDLQAFHQWRALQGRTQY
jgi:guanine deaminase